MSIEVVDVKNMSKDALVGEVVRNIRARNFKAAAWFENALCGKYLFDLVLEDDPLRAALQDEALYAQYQEWVDENW